nr:immunoglobulin heavy chain junction region [Mus musculus]
CASYGSSLYYYAMDYW